MRLSIKLALRYFRTRRKSLARFTAAAAVIGIAAGVASLIVADALARGFADEMQDKILGNTAHIAVSFKDGSEIFNWNEVSEKITRIENVEAISPTAYTNSIIIGEQAVSYAVLIAKNEKSKNEKTDNENPLEISLGEKLAEKIGSKIGDEVELVTLRDQTDPRRSTVVVTDLLQTGIYDYDSTWIYISPEGFAALNQQLNFLPSILSVSVSDIYKTPSTAEQIRAALGENFQVIDWQQANQPLFAALGLERKVSLAIISLIIFIAALNITTTLALLVNERKLDIAVLRTCGARTKTLVSIFLVEGLLIGLGGIVIGVAAGLTACFFGNYFKIVSLAEQVYSLSYIPFHTRLSSVLLIIAAALVICLAAAAYPAYRASRVKPLDNLRMN